VAHLDYARRGRERSGLVGKRKGRSMSSEPRSWRREEARKGKSEMARGIGGCRRRGKKDKKLHLAGGRWRDGRIQCDGWRIWIEFHPLLLAAQRGKIEDWTVKRNRIWNKLEATFYPYSSKQRIPNQMLNWLEMLLASYQLLGVDYCTMSTMTQMHIDFSSSVQLQFSSELVIPHVQFIK
jgi:hypothetical protein